MATTKQIPQALAEQLRHDREKIAAELPELLERGQRLEEAATENSLSGHLRRAIHRSGQPLATIAAAVGLDVFVLCDFLEGTRTLRSDVLDRLVQAVGAEVHLEPVRAPGAPSPAQTPGAAVRPALEKGHPGTSSTPGQD